MIGNIGSPFQWGSQGRKLTPEQVARERERADQMLQGVGDTSPVQHWLQGAGRVVNAITGKVQERRADASEELGLASADEYIANDPVLASLIGGGSPMSPMSAPMAGPVAGPNQDIANDTMAAIGQPARVPASADAAMIRQGLVARGLPEHVADGFVLNMQDESGLNPGINEIAPLVPGSRGGFGLYQLTGPRRVAYEQFAQQRGVDPADVDAQLDFLVAELQGPESAAAREILSTQDAGSAAAAIVNKFLRPSEEHRARREARYLGGGGMSASGQPVPITGGGGDVVGALASAMSNPWVAQKYGPVIEALMDQQMRRGDAQYQQQLAQADPMYQAKLAQLTRPEPVSAPETQVFYDEETGQEYRAQFNPATQTWDRVGGVKAPSGPLVENVIDMGADKFAEAFASGDAAALSTISESGIAAQRNLARIDQLAGLLETTPSGLAGAAKLRAGEWGINTDGLSDLQAAQALINSLVPEQRQPGSGPMSDADLDLFKQSLPRIINQPGGNQAIVGTMRAIAEYDAQGAQIVQRLRAGEIDRAQAFAELQARPDPMAQFRQTMGAMPQAGASGEPGAAAPAGLADDDLKWLEGN